MALLFSLIYCERSWDNNEFVQSALNGPTFHNSEIEAKTSLLCYVTQKIANNYSDEFQEEFGGSGDVQADLKSMSTDESITAVLDWYFSHITDHDGKDAFYQIDEVAFPSMDSLLSSSAALEDRATNAENAAIQYASAHGAGAEPLDLQVTDLMSDIIHLCAFRGIDFAEIIERGMDDFLGEVDVDDCADATAPVVNVAPVSSDTQDVDCGYEYRQSDIQLGDVSDTWELVRTKDDSGDECEDVLAVFQTEHQVAKYCSVDGIKPVKS